MVLFHGSNVIVTNPKVLINGFYKDFGYECIIPIVCFLESIRLIK